MVGRQYECPAVWWSNVYRYRLNINFMRQWVADLAVGHFKLFEIKHNSLLTVWYAHYCWSQFSNIVSNRIIPNLSIKIIEPYYGGTMILSSHLVTVLYWRLSKFSTHILKIDRKSVIWTCALWEESGPSMNTISMNNFSKQLLNYHAINMMAHSW